MLRDLTCVTQDFRILDAERDGLLHFRVGLDVISTGGERPGVGVESESIVAPRQLLPRDLQSFGRLVGVVHVVSDQLMI